MATTPILRKDIERAFYSRHTTGVTAQTPYGLLKRMYYIQYLAGTQTVGTSTSLNDLKIKWMRKYLADKGKTAPSQNFESDAWKAMVTTIAGISPVTSTSTNIVNFFINAP